MMETTLNDYIKEYKAQLEKGFVPKAYRSLIEYVMNLKTYFLNKYPDDYITSNVHQGYMDVSFFTFTPVSLKKEKLKIAIVFNHEKIRFEIWLAAQNKQIQKKYWEVFKDSNWTKYHISSSTDDVFSIVDSILVENPNFNDLETLTKQIESHAMKFIGDITDAIG